MNKADLIAQLADGKFHSGSDLGQQLGVSRAAIWKAIQEMDKLGLEVHAVSGRGYRLHTPISLLQAEAIKAFIPESCQQFIPTIDVLFEVDSTNAYLMHLREEQKISGRVCLAEFQQQGRGRRGREWVSPFGANIYLSLLWRFSEGTAKLSGLSLAVAVSLVKALEQLGIHGVGIKWPNDLLLNRRKLAGILLELSGDPMGACDVVCGIGLNVAMPPTASQAIDQAWTDLREAGLVQLDRNRLVGTLLGELVRAFQTFERHGFGMFKDDWQRYDLTAGQPITLSMFQREIQGIARGVDDAGMLLIEKADGMQRFASGEVSLRLRADGDEAPH